MSEEKYLQFGKYTRDCPEWLIEKARGVLGDRNSLEDVRKVLGIVADEFNKEKHETTYTNQIRESRLITVPEVLEKRQRSCGSVVNVLASVLRSLGIPAKLIHGRYVEENPNMRHAWVEVFVGGEWIPLDIMMKNYELDEFHKKESEHLDWEELEGKF